MPPQARALCASAARSISSATISWSTRRTASIGCSPGHEVRLRYAYFVTCRSVVKDAEGEVVEVRCSYDPATRGGNSPDGRKVRGTLHWVAADDAVAAEVRLYDPLFARPDPGAGGDLIADVSPNSVEVLTGCRVEPSLAGLAVGEVVQFERQGYFCLVMQLCAARRGWVFNRHGRAEGYLGEDPGRQRGVGGSPPRRAPLPLPPPTRGGGMLLAYLRAEKGVGMSI